MNRPRYDRGVPLLLVLAAACATTKPSPRSEGGARNLRPASLADLNGAADRARELIRQGRFDQAEQVLAPVRDVEQRSDRLGADLADLDATLHLYRGDLDGAARIYVDRLPVAAGLLGKDGDEEEIWLHNELKWLEWARSDLTSALVENEEEQRSIERAPFSESKKAELRKHPLWGRAYLLLEIGAKKEGPAREAALDYARQAQADFARAAQAGDDRISLAVLASAHWRFMGDGKRALQEAKSVDVKNYGDLQDLYLLARAIESGGDPAGAEALRERILRSDTVSMMRPLVLYLMKHDD